ncbi:MAG: fatty acid desaturase [Methylococcaceae bacterium]|jgi:fatty acid desaturase
MNQVKQKPRGKGILSRHPFWLGKYYAVNIAIYTLAALAVLSWNQLFASVSLWWLLSLVPLFLNRFRYIAVGSALLAIATLSIYGSAISWIYLILLPIAIYIGHLSAVFIHNAVHDNFKPIWLNPIIGELCALHQLSAGYPVFRLIHNQHHSHADDPVKDPHPPMGYSFWDFVDQSRALIKSRLTAMYFDKWGDSLDTRKNWQIQSVLLIAVRFSKTLFLFALLGPKIFVLLFLPSYLSNVFLFAAFNYFTHIEKEDGSTEILNLDNNWYYKICNRTLYGVFYHKNHHLRPKLFDPKVMKSLA